MSWAMYHAKSENFAGLAEAAAKRGELGEAISLYRQAAEQEAVALSHLDRSKVRTLGITTVSAASLFYKAREFRKAEAIAARGLAESEMPAFALEQLQGLLQAVWNEQVLVKSQLQFIKGEVLVSVSGGEVVTGGAPMDLIIRKVDEVGRIFFRTIEMMLNRPFRKRGAPSSEIQEQFRPWLFQAPAGSYQFSVRVERPRQMSLFPDLKAELEVEQITQKFLDIIKASTSESENDLANIVPNREYRDTFLKLTRNLAPRGTVFGKLEIRTAGEITPSVVLLPESRDSINQTLRKAQAEQQRSLDNLKETQLRGMLRGLQLDNDWLELNVQDDNPRTIRIYEAGDAIDDVVGPMVNHRVIVTVVERNGRFLLRDIQIDE